eukprot:698055-Pyramimonas_sp.AAC.1
MLCVAVQGEFAGLVVCEIDRAAPVFVRRAASRWWRCGGGGRGRSGWVALASARSRRSHSSR